MKKRFYVDGDDISIHWTQYNLEHFKLWQVGFEYIILLFSLQVGNKVCMKGGKDIFTGEQEVEEWFVTQIPYERIVIAGKGTFLRKQYSC